MVVLRTCRICGIEGTAEDLAELFYSDKLSKHGYRNICKTCSNKNRKNRAKKAGGEGDQLRNKQWIEQHDGPIFCYFCEEEITKFRGRESESFCLHSFDGHHDNWNEENKKSAHYGCHSHYHNFKGDDVPERTKYMRGWRARRKALGLPYDYHKVNIMKQRERRLRQ